jgi:hypothetical protein
LAPHLFDDHRTAFETDLRERPLRARPERDVQRAAARHRYRHLASVGRAMTRVRYRLLAGAGLHPDSTPTEPGLDDDQPGGTTPMMLAIGR